MLKEACRYNTSVGDRTQNRYQKRCDTTSEDYKALALLMELLDLYHAT